MSENPKHRLFKVLPKLSNWYELLPFSATLYSPPCVIQGSEVNLPNQYQKGLRVTRDDTCSPDRFPPWVGPSEPSTPNRYVVQTRSTTPPVAPQRSTEKSAKTEKRSDCHPNGVIVSPKMP